MNNPSVRNSITVELTFHDLTFRATAVWNAGSVEDVDIDRLDEDGWNRVEHPTPELEEAVLGAMLQSVGDAHDYFRTGW